MQPTKTVLGWFWIAWGGFAITWAIAVFFVGEFTRGKGSRERLITQANDPWTYWATIIGIAMLGTTVLVVGVRKRISNQEIAEKE